jgi:general L-amino acid transport system permease protein
MPTDARLDTTVVYVASGTLPTLPPPAGVAVTFWQRQHKTYFGTPLNAVLTILTLLIILWAGPKLLNWALLSATWSGDRAACLAAGDDRGACWAFVREKIWFSIFGLYPYELRWRPTLVLAIFGVVVALCVQRQFWRRELAYAVAGGLLMMVVVMGWGLPWLPNGLALVAVLAIIAVTLAAVAALVFDIARRRLPGSLGDARTVVAAALGLGAAALVLFCLSVTGLPASLASGTHVLVEVPTRLWGGVLITVFLAVFGLAVAYPIGILLALGRRSNLPVVKAFCVAWIELIRGVPLISLLFMAIFILPLFLAPGVDIDRFLRAQVAFIVFAAAYLAEVFRGGLQALPKGQSEAADALGLGYWQRMRFIVLPQALKITIPAQVNTFIGLFKDTTLVVIIGVFDFFTTLRAALGDPNWLGFATEAYVYAAAVYFVACYAMSRYSRKLEVELNPERRR